MFLLGLLPIFLEFFMLCGLFHFDYRAVGTPVVCNRRICKYIGWWLVANQLTLF